MTTYPTKAEIKALEKAERATRRNVDDIGRALAALGTAERAARKAGVSISTHEAKMKLYEACTALEATHREACRLEREAKSARSQAIIDGFLNP